MGLVDLKERRKREKKQGEGRKKEREWRMNYGRFLSAIPLFFRQLLLSRGRLPLRGLFNVTLQSFQEQRPATALHIPPTARNEEKPRKGREQEADNEVKERRRKERTIISGKIKRRSKDLRQNRSSLLVRSFA